MSAVTPAGREAKNLGVWLCRVRVLSEVWRCSLGILCGLAVVLVGLKAECVICLRRLLVLGAILVLLQLHFAWEGLSRGPRDNQELRLSLHPETGRVLSAGTRVWQLP